MTTPIPAEELRARQLLLALRRMGPNGEGFDALLSGLRRPRTGDRSRWLAQRGRG